MIAASTAVAATTVRVWDRWVRGLHWLLAAAAGVAWASGHWPPRVWFDEIHHTAGYVAIAAVVMRLVVGFTGERSARFAQFVRGPRATLDYSRQVLRGCEHRHIGHNPLGAWMVVALLTSIAALGLTGFLYTTDWLWGYDWLARSHAALAWMLTVLVPWHLAGVAWASTRHHENLVAAMVHGRKRKPGIDDIV